MSRVLIADKMSPLAAKVFEENNIAVDVKTGLSEDALCDIIGQYQGLAIRSSTKVTQKVIKKATSLQVIGRAGIGVDNIDQKAATAQGVIVMNTPFGNSITTAEHSIAMMLSVARSVPQANASTHAGKWEKSKYMGVEVAGKILGLIGCGNIGSIVADRAQGLKMQVLVYDPFLNEEKANELHVEKVELDVLLRRADFISLHTPLNEATKGILCADSLKKTKAGVRIINCARGGLIVESDLKEAIQSGHVAGAALDVFSQEPAKENILFGMEEVVCTPHLGASTAEAQENVAIQVAQQIAQYLRHGTIVNALNISSVSAEDAAKLRPYVQLGRQLGHFSGQLLEGGIRKITIEYEGQVAKLNSKPVTSMLLSGLFSTIVEHVNMVNAPLIARDRGIEVKESKSETVSGYQTLIKLMVTTDKAKHYVVGTLLGGRQPRIVDVDGVKLEAALGNIMLYINNQDIPGLIGNLGKILGDAQVNIANFHLGRSDQKHDAVALVEVDSLPDESILENIRQLPSVLRVKLLHF